MTHRTAPTRIAAVALLAIALACTAFAGIAQAKARGSLVNVMTRNLYLGADLTPGDRIDLEPPNSSKPTAASTARSKRPTSRSAPRGWPRRSCKKNPTWSACRRWRSGAPPRPRSVPLFSGKPEATTVKYDFLKLLLAQLNKKKALYKPVVVQDEFDFEAPADANGVPGDGPGGTGLLANAETNARLTMRDVILAAAALRRRHLNPKSGNFSHLLVVKVAGAKKSPSPAAGPASTPRSAAARSSTSSTPTSRPSTTRPNPSVRAQQASELVAPGGPATSSLPVILVGDLNSDVKTEVKPGDGQAYQVMTAGRLPRAGDQQTDRVLHRQLLRPQNRQQRRDEPQGRPHHDQLARKGEAARPRRSPAAARPTATGTPTTPGLFSALNLLR